MRTWLLFVSLSAACGRPAPEAEAPPPAEISHPVAEDGLARVHLGEEALARLGLETAQVVMHSAPARRALGGEVMIPPGQVVTVAAPVAGRIQAASAVAAGASVRRGERLARLVPLAPVDRDTRARAQRELAAAEANLRAAETRTERTESLAAGRAGSQRAIEEAVAARDVARADATAAQARLEALQAAPLAADVSLPIRSPVDGVVRAVGFAPSQVVPAGATLLEVVGDAELWVRVPVAAADLGRIDDATSAAVASLSPRSALASVAARPIAGPPTASPLQGTVDRYFAIEGAAFAPGERVLVWLPLAERGETTAVPYGAIFYDASGAAWVYVCEDERTFRRARVDPLRREGELAILAHGPPIGTCVVSTGVAEVYGTEFEPRH